MKNKSVSSVSIKKISDSASIDAKDLLAIEEPLEIQLGYGLEHKRTKKSISVTMRTPGSDADLAVGFLFSEGIIKSDTLITDITHVLGKQDNIILVELGFTEVPHLQNSDRNFYTTSSCGVCGKASIASIKTVCDFSPITDSIKIPNQLLCQLPAKLKAEQNIFEQTGGIHACALFDITGKLILVREDVGRHNALDKLIGSALKNNMLPLDMHILLLSGRISFELIQKATMAGIKIVAGVGAPSSLAVEMAEEWEMTLVGFLRDYRYNIYSGAERIVIL